MEKNFINSVVSDVIHNRQFFIEWFCLLVIFKEDELEDLYGWRKKRGRTYWIDCFVSFFQVSLTT